ncbi:MAG: non-homologous end-joining DNA ligase [Desulfovibrionales bacterium]
MPANTAFEHLSRSDRDRLRKKKQPEWTAPMLATLTDKRFSDPDWIFERKLDGERCLVFRKGSSIRLMSRNRKEINDTYPELVDAFADQTSEDFVVDGEIVAFAGNTTSFSRLQNRMHLQDPSEARNSGIRVYCYLFDLLHLQGHDTTQLPLRSRKSLLKSTLSFDDPLRFTTHRNEHGKDSFQKACEKGWEGLIAKDGTSTYVHSRSRKWLKFKCVNRQEFVIGGYTAPEGKRKGFGAILIGYNQDGEFRYAGKVGTGFSDETLETLKDRFDTLERKKSPFADGVREKNATWVTPNLVCEVAFTEWTDDGKLRHPRFQGLRRDKDPKEVMRES